MKKSLKGFELIRPGSEGPFLTLSKYGITFSKQSIECLEYPAYVHAYLNRSDRKMAVQVTEKDRDAIAFMKDEAAKSRSFVRWSNRSLLREMLELTGETLNEGALRVNGVYDPDENMIIFDLNDHQPVAGSKKA